MSVRAKKIQKAEIKVELKKRRMNVNLSSLVPLAVTTKTWVDNYPEVLNELKNTVYQLFQLGNDVTNCKITLIPPSKEEGIIKKSEMSTGSRIILTVGSNECYTMKGPNNSEKKLSVKNGEAVNVPFCFAAGLDFAYDNNVSIKSDPRPGFRSTSLSKRPDNRFIIIFDFTVNNDKLIKTIKSEVTKLSKGDKGKAEELEKFTIEALESDGLNLTQ